MSKSKSSHRSSHPKNSLEDKQNQDHVYLIQNENQILRLKNRDIDEKIILMRKQLRDHNEKVVRYQADVNILKQALHSASKTEDILLDNDKKVLIDRLMLIEDHVNVATCKLGEVKRMTFTEEEKLPNIQTDKIDLQRELWRAKIQKEGTKVSFDNIQKQVKKIKSENQAIVGKRKNFSPKENEISSEIEERIRIVKNNKDKCSEMRKKEVMKVLDLQVLKIKNRIQKQSFILIERYSLVKSLLKKKIFMLSLIRKKYLNFIKVRALQILKDSFRPLIEIGKTAKIIEFTRKRRIKNQIFRIWRSQSAKAQFNIIRKFQIQNSIQKMFQSVLNSNVYSAFNILRYYKNNFYHFQGCKKISQIININIKRSYNLFVSRLLKVTFQLQRQIQIQQNAKEQSQMLIKSIFFGGWAKVAKDNKIVNRTIKFRYFRQLKKLVALGNRRKLGQMLTIANGKLMQIDILSKNFGILNKQTINGLMSGCSQQNKQVKDKIKKAQDQLGQIVKDKDDLYKQMSLLKVSYILKKQMGKSFSLWRNWTKKCNKLRFSMIIINEKINSNINFAFFQLQKKRFDKLKASIAEKIKSCEFSYNYLIEQNQHIKNVLDTKNLELQRSKFVGILQKLIRYEKQIKHKYFFKFLKSGIKCWRFKKMYQRLDSIMSGKLKRIFIFLLKQTEGQQKYQQKIEYLVAAKVANVEKAYMRKGFRGFSELVNKNKKIKRVLGGIFQRNLQLDSYNFYNKMKKVTTDYYQGIQFQAFSQINNQRLEVQRKMAQTSQTIEVLTNRLKYKECSLANRKVLALRLFFIRNIQNYVGEYIERWNDKVKYQKKVLEFAKILERKTRIIIHTKFIIGLQKKLNQKNLGELQGKADRFKQQLQNQSNQYDKFASAMQNQSEKMKSENQNNKVQTENLQHLTDHMDEIKLQSFEKHWKGKILQFTIKVWKDRIIQLKNRINRMFQIMSCNAQKQCFDIISDDVKQEMVKKRIKENLSQIYSKNYRFNMSLMLRVWRIVNWNKKVFQKEKQFQIQNKSMERIYNIYNYRLNRHYRDADFRLNDRKLRRIFDFIKKYARLKVIVNQKKATLSQWLRIGYQVQFTKIFIKNYEYQKKKRQNIKKFKNGQILKEAQLWFNKLASIILHKKTIKRLFIDKFIPQLLFRMNNDFMSKVKNYHRFMVVSKKDRQTYCIQKVIECFQKKRKYNLCQNLRRWRKNLYLMKIQFDLLRKLTRKAIYNRLEGCFFAWKRQKEGKNVVIFHSEEGEIKKRKFEVLRLEKYLQDYKKQKGLLIENQEGDFIVSPRFQDQKDKQITKDNTLRYRFISRVILSMNGYNPAVKAWNNLQMYSKLRQKYKKGAQFVLNSFRKPDLCRSFKIWHKATKQFQQMFDIMDRKALIRVLTRQKDKMQIYYSNKIIMEEEIKEQLSKYKILSYQDERRQKLCAILFNRHARNTKLHALLTWKKRIQEIKQLQCNQLEERGEQKIYQTEQNLKDLQEDEKYLRGHNQKLHQAVKQALQIAEMVRRITEERDILSRQILEKQLTSEALIQQNQALNSKLYLAQKEAMNLLVLSSSNL